MFYGLDGCRGGWCLARLSEDGSGEVAVLPTFADAVGKIADRSAAQAGANAGPVLSEATIVFVDMPIGLPDGEKVKSRRCDALARQGLGSRGSSVFPVPVRAAVEASDYEAANAAQRKATNLGLSLQSWALVPKIREVDAAVQSIARAESRGVPEAAFYESHPELCFARLNGGQPVEWSKREAAGVLARGRLLTPYIPDLWDMLDRQLPGLAPAGVPSPAASIDDVLDALVLAVHARLSVDHGLIYLPEETEVDACGLPMRIVTAAPPSTWPAA